MRTGDDRLIRALDTKAMSYGSGQDGGYLVPNETEAEIGKRLAELSPIRSIAAVRQVSAAVLKKPFSVSGPAVGWVAETAARPQTDTATLADCSSSRRWNSTPCRRRPPSLLDDTLVDLDEWLAGEVEDAFAAQETTAFVTGDGTNKPKGFLDYDQGGGSDLGVGPDRLCGDRRRRRTAGERSVGQADRPGLCAQGRVPAERAVRDEPQDAGVDPQVQGRRRQLSLAAAGGAPASRAMLLGFPVIEIEDMPDIAANSAADRVRRLRARLSDRRPRRACACCATRIRAKPYVLFYTTKRVGGGVQDFDAIKVMKYGAS